MSTTNYIYVTNSNPGSSTVALTPTSATNTIPGTCLVWASSGTFVNQTSGAVKVQSNFICQSSQSLMLDGYDPTLTQKNGCYLFKATLNFTLLNPIYTDDENDLCLMYIVFPSTSTVKYNSEQTFNITCSMHNLGSMATSPVYQLTTTNTTDKNGILPTLVIPINKWFAFRSPGSIYQLRVEGYTNALCSPPQQTTNTCPCNIPT
jgi:hypothetical protein